MTAMQLEATLDDMLFTVHAHPTVWEALGDAFASVRGLAINAIGPYILVAHEDGTACCDSEDSACDNHSKTI